MPSQLVLLPSHTLHAVADALDGHDLTRPYDAWRLRVIDGAQGVPTVGMLIDPLLLCPTRRAAFQDYLLAVVLASGTEAVPLPRPLPGDLVLHLLRELEAYLAGLDGLSGHERVGIGEVLRSAASAIKTPAAAIPARPPTNLFEAELIARGARYQQILAPALPRLAGRLDRFRHRLYVSRVEAAMVKLDAQAEIGSALRLSSDDGGLSVARLSYRPRRGDLPELIHATQNQLLASVQATLMADPNTLDARAAIGVDELQALHVCLMRGLIPSEDLGRWRSGGIAICSSLSGEEIARGLPGALLESHMAQLMAAFEPGLWADLHPLVRAAMFHVRFERAHPFRDGNGRVGRMALSCMLAESGWPLLPLNIVLHWRRGAYLDALSRAAAADDDLPFLQFLLKAVEEAITLGHRMLDLLMAERRRLLEALGAFGHGVKAGIRICDMLLSTLIAPNFGVGLLPQWIMCAFNGLAATGGLLKVYVDDRIGYAMPSLGLLMHQPLPGGTRGRGG